MCQKWSATIPSVSMHILNLVKFYQFVLEILSGNEIVTGEMTDGRPHGMDNMWLVPISLHNKNLAAQLHFAT